MKKYFFALVLCICLPLYPKVILWDLGGVLFEPSKFGVAQEIGFTHFLSHAFWDLRSPASIQKTLFEILSILEQTRADNKGIAGSATGMELPTIMCRWQAGMITGKEVLKKVIPLVKKLYKYDYFDSKAHADLVLKCFEKMFDPEVLAHNVYPVEQGFELVVECKQRRNKDGSPLHRQFVFSNWDHLSFDYFRKHNRVFFSYFEQIVISGHIKRIKPHADAFEYLITTYNLDPAECILIDDQESNIRAARKCGMKGILIHNRNYDVLRADLVRHKILE